MPFPLGESDEAPFVDGLVGDWYTGDIDGVIDLYSIYRFNDREYLVQVLEGLEYASLAGLRDTSMAVSLPAVQLARAFLTPVGDLLFGSVQCVPCDERPYTFYRVHLGDDARLNLSEVDHGQISQLASAEELRAFLSANATDEALYSDHLVLARLPAQP